MKITYTETDHRTWSMLMEKSDKLLAHANKEFLVGFEKLKLPKNRVPEFAEINKTLLAATGWSYVPFEEVATSRSFLEHLGNRQFISSINVRTVEELEFCKLPDIFHDVFGHAAMLMDEQFCQFLYDLGQLALNNASDEMIEILSRLYWYTVEVGLVKENGAIKYYGGSIISSLSEAKNISSPSVEIIPLDIERLVNTPYDSYAVNPYYFLANSLSEIYSLPEVLFKKV